MTDVEVTIIICTLIWAFCLMFIFTTLANTRTAASRTQGYMDAMADVASGNGPAGQIAKAHRNDAS